MSYRSIFSVYNKIHRALWFWIHRTFCLQIIVQELQPFLDTGVNRKHSAIRGPNMHSMHLRHIRIYFVLDQKLDAKS